MNPLYNQLANAELESSWVDKNGDTKYHTIGGMTKLEAFTMAALNGLLSNSGMKKTNENKEYASVSVAVAKATLDALAEEQGMM